MKNLFFAITLLTASTFSFGSTSSSSVTPPTKDNCFPFTLSCGVQGQACGDDLMELIDLIMIADDAICN